MIRLILQRYYRFYHEIGHFKKLLTERHIVFALRHSHHS